MEISVLEGVLIKRKGYLLECCFLLCHLEARSVTICMVHVKNVLSPWGVMMVPLEPGVIKPLPAERCCVRGSVLREQRGRSRAALAGLASTRELVHSSLHSSHTRPLRVRALSGASQGAGQSLAGPACLRDDVLPGRLLRRSACSWFLPREGPGLGGEGCPVRWELSSGSLWTSGRGRDSVPGQCL